jgi:hypothetical protein
MSALAPLGRLVSKDERDKKFLLTRPKRGETLPDRRVWNISTSAILDQGNTPQCVGHAGRHYLSAGPVVNKGGPTARGLYDMAQINDEWPGQNYEGTSVRGLFKAFKQINAVNEYRWAYDVETVMKHVLTTGPMVMGTDWHMDMFTPDRWGYVHVAGDNAGGHSWLIIGVDRYRKCPLTGDIGAARCVNSWGTSWGQSGRFWLTLRDLDKLIQADGEACVAPELKLT